MKEEGFRKGRGDSYLEIPTGLVSAIEMREEVVLLQTARPFCQGMSKEDKSSW